MTSRARLMLALALVGLVTAPAGAAVAAPVAAVPAPHVVPRSEWGAQAPACSSTSAPGWTNAVVHHTDGPTTSTPEESAEAVRNVQTEHMRDNGWCDIGYHFLVDQAGTIYEGAQGSLDRVPVGAHVGGFNTGSLGVALIGNFTEQEPSAAMLAAVGQIVGWELGLYGVDPDTTIVRIAGEGVVGRPIGTELTVPVIAGHRDLGVTECPGDAAYAQLPAVRAGAAEVVAAMRASGQFGSLAPRTEPTGLDAAADGGPNTAVVVAGVVVVVIGSTVVVLRATRSMRYPRRTTRKGAPARSGPAPRRRQLTDR